MTDQFFLVVQGQEAPSDGDYVMLDDEGRLMVGAHHYTAESIRARIAQLKRFASGSNESAQEWANLDWRGFCNTTAHIMSALSAEVVPTEGEGKTAAPQAEPVAKVVSSGPHDFPLLQWLSAEHSFSVPIGTMLYAGPAAVQADGGDARDAARYRWLREQSHPWGTGVWLARDALDAAVDAARTQGQPAQGEPT